MFQLQLVIGLNSLLLWTSSVVFIQYQTAFHFTKMPFVSFFGKKTREKAIGPVESGQVSLFRPARNIKVRFQNVLSGPYNPKTVFGSWGSWAKNINEKMMGNPKHSIETPSESPRRPLKIAKIESCSEDEVEPDNPTQPMIQKPGIQRYLVAIEYIGTRFSGSQKQPNCRTVVGVLEVLEWCTLELVEPEISRKRKESPKVLIFNNVDCVFTV